MRCWVSHFTWDRGVNLEKIPKCAGYIRLSQNPSKILFREIQKHKGKKKFIVTEVKPQCPDFTNLNTDEGGSEGSESANSVERKATIGTEVKGEAPGTTRSLYTVECIHSNLKTWENPTFLPLYFCQNLKH